MRARLLNVPRRNVLGGPACAGRASTWELHQALQATPFAAL